MIFAYLFGIQIFCEGLNNLTYFKLEKRRHYGSEKKKQEQLEEHLKKNPKLAEKVKLLEELKAKAGENSRK